MTAPTKQTHTPGPWVEIIEGLNAITDNAIEWTPRQIADHAQSLAVAVDELRYRQSDLLEACKSAEAMLDCLASEDDGTKGTAAAFLALRAAIAKAEGRP